MKRNILKKILLVCVWEHIEVSPFQRHPLGGSFQTIESGYNLRHLLHVNRSWKGIIILKECTCPWRKKGTKCPQNQCFSTECSTPLRFPLTMFTSSTYPSRPCHTCETPSAVYPLQTDRSSCSLPRQTPVIFIFKHVFHSGNNLQHAIGSREIYLIR